MRRAMPSLRGPLALAGCLFLVWATAVSARQPLATQQQPATGPGSFQVLARQVADLFPEVRTDVVEVAGDRITIAAGRNQGLQPGVELTAFREGRELYHPVTKQLLGRTEEILGRLVVAEAFDGYAIATPAPGASIKPIRAGDPVRGAAGRVRLSVLTLNTGVRPRLVEAAVYDLVRELEATGRFQVVFGDQIGVWLAERGIPPEAFMRGRGVAEAQARFKLPHLLAAHFTLAQGKPFMDVRLFAGAAEAPRLAQALFVPPSVRAAPAQPFSAGGVGEAKLERRSLLARLLSGDFEPYTYSAGAASIPIRALATFPFTVLAMDVAVAGDGVPRLVLSDGQRVFLYRLVGEKLEAEWTYDRRMVGNILSVQFAELSGDQVPEVVVNRHDADTGMLSYILTTRDGRPRVLVEDIPLILLAVDEKGEGIPRALWGQPPNPLTFFTPGPVTRYVLQDGDVKENGRVPAPPEFRLTGAVFSNTGGKDSRVLAFVDQRNRLNITASGQEMWRSLTPVGGGLARARLAIMQGRTAVDRYFKIEPNPVAVDLDGDGIQEIVLPVNEEERGRMAVIFRGPAGFRMQVVTSGFEGIITGLGAVPGEGNPSLIVAVTRRTGLLGGTGNTQILMTIPE